MRSFSLCCAIKYIEIVQYYMLSNCVIVKNRATTTISNKLLLLYNKLRATSSNMYIPYDRHMQTIKLFICTILNNILTYTTMQASGTCSIHKKIMDTFISHPSSRDSAERVEKTSTFSVFSGKKSEAKKVVFAASNE